MKKLIPMPQQDKNSMEGSGSEFNEAKASSWERKVELSSFDRSIEGETDSELEFDEDGDNLELSENKSNIVDVLG